MTELEQEETLETSELYELDSDELDANPTEYSGLTRENYVDRVRFTRVPSGGRSEEGSGPTADPLYIYYRSMSKIPLLTREEEVYLAKKIESAKVNILRLLSLTPINSRKLVEMADDLHPAGAPREPGLPDPGKESVADIPLEVRERLRSKAIKRIVNRLERLEGTYSGLKTDLDRSRNGNREKKLSRIKNTREAVFQTLSRLDFSENQSIELVSSLELVLVEMEEAERA